MAVEEKLCRRIQRAPGSRGETLRGAIIYFREREIEMDYAGFWKRFAAAFIDGIILTAISFPIGFVLGFAMALTVTDDPGVLGAVGRVLGIVIGWCYYAIMESSATQATLGKMALGIKVTDIDGNRIGFGRATGRHFAKIISAIILLIGYIMAAFTPKKQALHDMMADCLVVTKDYAAAGTNFQSDGMDAMTPDNSSDYHS